METETHENPSQGREPVGETFLALTAQKIAASLPGERGAIAAEFFRCVHFRTPLSYFSGASPEEAKAEALDLFEFFEAPLAGFRVRRRPGSASRQKALQPDRMALETVGPDQPFLLDSLLELIRVRRLRPLEIVHPIIAVRRGSDGRVTALGPPGALGELVSVIRIELDGAGSEAERDALVAEAASVLEEARVAVEDFEAMLSRLSVVKAELVEEERTLPRGEKASELAEVIEFTEWLRKANFVFLGYRSYTIAWENGDATAGVDSGSGLGMLRDESRSSFAVPKKLSSLPEDQRLVIQNPSLLLVHKAHSESRVLRRARMDHVVFKSVDSSGRPVREHSFLGLFTARAYNDLAADIPVLRRKLDAILAKAGVLHGSHDHKEIFSLYASIPKAELFALDSEKIGEMIFAIMGSSTRRAVRVTYRPDLLERGASVMVLMPKERFNADVRASVQDLLASEFKASVADYRLALGEEPMARLHFYLTTSSGPISRPALHELERKATELTRTWDDRLLEALQAERGNEEAARLISRYEGAFPPAYVAERSAATAAVDIRHVDLALERDALEVAVVPGRIDAERKVSVLKIFSVCEPYALSTLMPILTHLGLQVLDEETFRIAARPSAAKPGADPRAAGCAVYLHSFDVTGPGGEALPPGQATRNVEEVIPRILRGEYEDDALNALIPVTGLHHRQVGILRAYEAYAHQLGCPWTQKTAYAALTQNPEASRALLSIFEARFDPRWDAEERRRIQDTARAKLRAAMEQVSGIVEDEVLRFFEGLILATTRTNHFATGPEGAPRHALALKLRCADVPTMPDPRPLHEIFVHSPGVEGVHLRSGKVARGGIRWSNRIDDYRMEILGLMKAQKTKNSVIVPVGAKGGFVVKRPPQPKGDEIRNRYEVFIGALLDVTDNLVEGRVVHPAEVVIHDEDDPYLVVAADKGTATFSDTANAIATSRNFWLADAFASGGSRGFDHKKEGITARGAWECVRRHFREMGIDGDRGRFTAAGIGDMSGDVFGNGMLQSRGMQLLAAFNHVHIFLDPKPDPAVSYEERSRLFALPQSAWTDYDPKRISSGGGVFRRDAKTLRISPEARQMLGISEESLNGDELVRAILRMPVDLLFNGGIGTYVKARSESHADVSDPSNDAVRVDGADLQAKVVAEGGNLGFTQLGRVEYARGGGRLNTDFIDNSAGVDLSDHEVNLKILLSTAIRNGELEAPKRDEILRGVTREVSLQVLRDNYLQSRVLSVETRRGAAAVDDYRFLIDELSAENLLSRSVERIPTDQELARLRDSGMTLTRPQLAVILAYAKIHASARILETDLPDEPDLGRFLHDYFPAPIATRFASSIDRHRLRREIAATAAVNEAVNTMGIAFFHRVSRRTGKGFDGILRAYLAANGLANGPEFLETMDRLYDDGYPDTEAWLSHLASFTESLEEAVLAVLRRPIAGSAADIVKSYGPRLEELARTPSRELPAAAARGGLPDLPRSRLDRAQRLAEDLDLVDLREAAGGGQRASLDLVLEAWREAGESLLVDAVGREASRILRLTGDDIQTCASLTDKVRDLRRGLAGVIVRRAAERQTKSWVEGASSNAAVVNPEHRERRRVLHILERARTREPLSASGLYVVVEALGRIVSEVAPLPLPNESPRGHTVSP